MWYSWSWETWEKTEKQIKFTTFLIRWLFADSTPSAPLYKWDTPAPPRQAVLLILDNFSVAIII